MHAAITRTCVGCHGFTMEKLFSGTEVYRRKPGGPREQKRPSAIGRRTYGEHCEHQLAHVEGVSPVVVENHSVILPYCQKPPAQGLKWEGEAVWGMGLCPQRTPRQSGLSTRHWAGGWVVKSNYGAGGRSGSGSHLYLECEGVLWPLLTSRGSQECTWCPYLHTGKTVKHVTQGKPNKDIFNKGKENPKLLLTLCQILGALLWGP